jgi:hypothetical protein
LTQRIDGFALASYKGKLQQKGGNNHERTRQPTTIGAVTAAPLPPLSQPNPPTPPAVSSDVDPLFTLRPAPDREPPFDDERDPFELEPPGPMQLTLPFPPMHPPVRHRPAVSPRSPRRAAVGDPANVVRRLLVGVVEVAGRRRPLSQLAGLLSPSVAAGLREDLSYPGFGRHRLHRATLGGVRSTEPADGVAELSTTLRTATRVHAVAVRLEIRRGQWVCTRLVLG